MGCPVYSIEKVWGCNHPWSSCQFPFASEAGINLHILPNMIFQRSFLSFFSLFSIWILDSGIWRLLKQKTGAMSETRVWLRETKGGLYCNTSWICKLKHHDRCRDIWSCLGSCRLSFTYHVSFTYIMNPKLYHLKPPHVLGNLISLPGITVDRY